MRRARCLALDALLRCRPDQVRTFHFANGYRAYGIGGPGLLRHRPVQCRRVFSVAAGAGLAGAGPLGGAAGAERDEQGGEEQTIYTVKGPKQQVVIWMFVCGLLVFSIIIVGGLTRCAGLMRGPPYCPPPAVRPRATVRARGNAAVRPLHVRKC